MSENSKSKDATAPAVSSLSTMKVAKTALSHPIRLLIIGRLLEEHASPNMLAIKLELPLGTVAYHVRELYKLGLLKLVKTQQKRGATEHIYGLQKSGKSWVAIKEEAARISGDLSRLMLRIEELGW
jgi:DNA-binding transcriptional ArsR family regulator